MNRRYIWRVLSQLALLTILTQCTTFSARAAEKIAFASNRDGNEEIYWMNPDGSGQTNITHTSVDEEWPNWRPDGNALAYVRGGDIWTMDPDGINPTQLTTGGNKTQIDWHPDGSRILYSSPGASDWDIFSVPITGGAPTALVTNPYGDYEADWSPDGTKIVFKNDDGGSREEIYVCNADGSGQVRLTTTGGNNHPRWSPDGSKIVFESSRDTGLGQIYVMNVDGSGQTRLTNNTFQDLVAVWSPDGSKIAFTSSRDGNYEIYTMNADGSNQKRLTNSPGTDWMPEWTYVLPANSPSLSVSDVSVDEGTGSSIATFHVTLSAASTQTVTVKYRTINGTAVAPGDYTALASTPLSFAPGQTSKAVSVMINDDSIDERDETFQLQLSSAQDASIADALGVATITDNDPPPVVSIGDASAFESNSGSAYLNFPLTLSSPSGLPAIVSYTTVDATATAGSDYTAFTASSPGYAIIPPGQTSWTLTIPVQGDTIQEPDEVFLVNLAYPTNATLGDAQGLGTILNDDLPALTLAGNTVTEGNSGTTNLDFTVSLSYASSGPVTFNYITANGTALSGSDYTAISGSAIIAAGQTSKTISIAVKGDTVYEPDESVYLHLSNVVGATVTSTVPRNPDNGHYYEMIYDRLNWNQANAAAQARTYLGLAGHLVTITSEAEQNFVAPMNGGTQVWTAGVQPAGSSEPTGGWSWNTGEPFIYTKWDNGEPNNSNGGTENTIQIDESGLWNDVPDYASTSRYLVEYDATPNTSNPDLETAGIIFNDDPVPPALSINDVTVRESSSGSVAATFTVTQSGVSVNDTQVTYQTASGTAKAPLDFASKTGILTIPAGSTSGSFDITISSDSLIEVDETFAVNLTKPNNATIADGQGIGTIQDADITNPSLAIATPAPDQNLLISGFIVGSIRSTASDAVGVAKVEMKMTRLRNGVDQIWNGTAFTTTSARIAATLTGPATNVNWTINKLFPPQNQLDTGQYLILMTATDAAGNQASVTSRVNLYTSDTEAPVTYVNKPTLNQKVLIPDFTTGAISGTATDNLGIATIRIKLSRKRGTNYYWNGSAFTTSQFLLSATVIPVGGSTVKWNLDSQMPPASVLDSGLYQVDVYAVDIAGNKSATVTRPFTLGTDFISPSVAIVAPTSGQRIDINAFGAGTVNGTAGDNIGVTSVKVKLQRKRGSVTTYWNGSAFTTTAATVDATATGSTSATWSFDSKVPTPATGLDTGAYTLYASSYDAAGNIKTSASRSFTLMGSASPAPVSTPSSISAGDS